MSMNRAILLGLKAVANVEGGAIDASMIEIGIIERDSGFRRLSTEDIQGYLDKLVKKRG
jgi:20S proteasome alpha/beta subunit